MICLMVGICIYLLEMLHHGFSMIIWLVHVPVSLFLQAFHHYKIHLNVVCFSCMFYLHIDCKEKPCWIYIWIIQFFFSQEDKEGHWRECLMVCMSWLFGRPFCCQNIFYMYIPWFKISLLNGNLIFKLIEIKESAV